MPGIVTRTKFDKALDKALEIRRALDAAEASTKLSGPAFIRDACKLANCTEQRLIEIEDQLAKAVSNTGSAESFVRRMVAFFREPNAPNVPTDCGKFMRAYGSAEAAAQIAEMKATVGEFLALGVRQCTQRFPEAFGEVEDFEQHQARIADLRHRLVESYVCLEELVSGEDFEMDWASVTANERQAGLCRIRFRRHPDTVFREGWPVDLVSALLAYSDAPAKPKQPRGRPKGKSRPRVQLAA